MDGEDVRGFGGGLLANDCCFARSNTTGCLGLLHALRLTDAIRFHLKAGEPPHPTQDQQVTDALATGRARAVLSGAGWELKAYIWPEQLTRWFGMPLATTGTAAGVLMPRVTSSAGAPAHVNADRSNKVTADVFVTSGEERHPDFLGFTDAHNSGTPGAHTETLHHLNGLPQQAVDLNHNPAANAHVLAAFTASLQPMTPR
ncbi:hypothetical protein ACWDQO_26975 [Streptomyces sp. NPDC003703]|uniref:hypothetical protein n=1 Tax=Streptomyces sp. NPDC003283 TaxID=3364681 RepID=UPI003694F6DE